MKVAPIHTAKNPIVFHNNNKCTERNNIESKNIKKGDGGLRLCNRCEKLNAEGK